MRKKMDEKTKIQRVQSYIEEVKSLENILNEKKIFDTKLNTLREIENVIDASVLGDQLFYNVQQLETITEKWKKEGRKEESTLDKYFKAVFGYRDSYDSTVAHILKKNRKQVDRALKDFGKEKDPEVLKEKRVKAISLSAAYRDLYESLSLFSQKKDKTYNNALEFQEFHRECGIVIEAFESLKSNYSIADISSKNDLDFFYDRCKDMVAGLETQEKKYGFRIIDFKNKIDDFKNSLSGDCLEFEESVEKRSSLQEDNKKIKDLIPKLEEMSGNLSVLYENNLLIEDAIKLIEYSDSNNTNKFTKKLREKNKQLVNQANGILNRIYLKTNEEFADINALFSKEPESVLEIDSYLSNLDKGEQRIQALQSFKISIGSKIKDFDEKLQTISKKRDYLEGIKQKALEISSETKSLKTRDHSQIYRDMFDEYSRDPYLSELVVGYKEIANRVKNDKRKELEKSREPDSSNFYLSDFIIDELPYPPSGKISSLKHALMGVQDNTGVGRLARFLIKLEHLEPADKVDEVEYVRGLRLGLKQALKHGPLAREINGEAENQKLINDVYNGINDYISRSENNLGFS